MKLINFHFLFSCRHLPDARSRNIHLQWLKRTAAERVGALVALPVVRVRLEDFSVRVSLRPEAVRGVARGVARGVVRGAVRGAATVRAGRAGAVGGALS